MKNKIYKILGVAVSLALVASLCVFAIPGATPAEAGAPGKQKWSAQTLPTATSNVMYNGSDVTDIAVASDGLTIYVCNNAIRADQDGAVLVSTDGGQSFSKISAISTASASGNMTAIAVAPDDAGIMAVVEQTPLWTADVVHLTTNSGKTWTALPIAYDSAVAAANAHIMDVDVGPARSGCVFGREYVIAFADTRANSVDDGDVQIIGKIATWATIGSSNTPAVGDVAGCYDYMAVKFSPNFVGDRVVACVGANASAGDVYLQLVNDAQKLQVRSPVGVGATAIVDYDWGTALAINTADIAIPSDFDPSVSSLQRTYIAFGCYTTQTDADVYRITGSTVRDLDAVTAKAIKSITYSGTVDEGTLWLGEYLDENVKYTLDPTVSLPTWKSTKKAPSADPLTDNTTNAQTIVRVSPVDADIVFAATTGPESAFSVSNNAGVSFDGESLIDNGVADNVQFVQDIYLTPDGETIFMATADNTTGTYQINLWKSSLPTGSTSWSRVLVKTGTAGMVRLNPDWATTPSVYLIDVVAGGNIYVSTNGGDTFSTRSAPATITAADIVVESGSVLYLASGTSVRKSTNGAWTWGTPIGAKVTTILTLAMAASYPATPEEGVLLVGGTGACSYSTDGGTTFTKIATGLTSGSAYQILAHQDYATNSTIYCGDSTAGAALTYRWIIGESTAWEDMSTGGASTVSGLAMANGVLYASQSAAADGAMRTLYPTGTVGRQAWEEADIGVTAQTLAQTPSAVRAAGASNVVYAIDTSPVPSATVYEKVYAYSDLLAVDVPILAAPADEATVMVDPVSGYAEDIQFAWNAIGSGTGLVYCYEINIAIAGTSFGAPLTQTYGTSTTTNVPAPALAGLTTTNPQLTVGSTGQWAQNLMANTDYEWRIRARGQESGDGIRSGWSTARSFSVQAGGRVEAPYAGPLLLGPTGGATDVSLTPGFSWAPIARATEYQFILASDAGLTNTIAGTPVTVTSPAFQCTEKLAYGTVYFWAVKATKPTVSAQAIGSFTTMGEPVEPVAPVVVPPALPAPAPITPGYIWAIIGIGAVLVIVVIVLIVRTRRVV